MRDKKIEEQRRGKTQWEHLNEDLHVLVTTSDFQNRAEIKLERAIEEIRKLLIPANDGEDGLKKKQLMELAIINGTYRDNGSKGGVKQSRDGGQNSNNNNKGHQNNYNSSSNNQHQINNNSNNHGRNHNFQAQNNQ